VFLINTYIDNAIALKTWQEFQQLSSATSCCRVLCGRGGCGSSGETGATLRHWQQLHIRLVTSVRIHDNKRSLK